MASGRSRGHGPVRGMPRGKDASWMSDIIKERRFNFAWDLAQEAIDKTTECSKCGGNAICYNAAVTVGYGAVSFFTCRKCGREFTMQITPEKMEEYYHAALQKKIGRKVPGVRA
ncbi:hypothetical protein [Methanolobus sp. WCC5]|uniref:hypothetical protein n=1 Tax=Methanolobus sp. WCC5 TaxID=3125785 RepID=UPI00324B161A